MSFFKNCILWLLVLVQGSLRIMGFLFGVSAVCSIRTEIFLTGQSNISMFMFHTPMIIIEFLMFKVAYYALRLESGT